MSVGISFGPAFGAALDEVSLVERETIDLTGDSDNEVAQAHRGPPRQDGPVIDLTESTDEDELPLSPRRARTLQSASSSSSSSASRQAFPSDAVIQGVVREILNTHTDLQDITRGKLYSLLEIRFGLPLGSLKASKKEVVTEAMDDFLRERGAGSEQPKVKPATRMRLEVLSWPLSWAESHAWAFNGGAESRAEFYKFATDLYSEKLAELAEEQGISEEKVLERLFKSLIASKHTRADRP
jgi:hypothetical protein